jgi:exonuclease III
MLYITKIKMYKIANWNLERPKSYTQKAKLAIEKIKEINADIIVLTETSDAVDLFDHYPYKISTLPYERTPNEQWVSVLSKWKITKQLKTFDNYRTVSGIIESPFGEFSIFGTIIPYHQAGVSGVRYGNLDYKTWEFHEKDLYAQSRNWKKILETEKLPLFIIGDFNQTRFNNEGYGTPKIRQILTDLLKELDINCVTEIDFSEKYLSKDPKKGKIRNNIDHICISNNLLNQMKMHKVGAWNHFTEQGKFMSDHNGVFIEFEI